MTEDQKISDMVSAILAIFAHSPDFQFKLRRGRPRIGTDIVSGEKVGKLNCSINSLHYFFSSYLLNTLIMYRVRLAKVRQEHRQ